MKLKKRSEFLLLFLFIVFADQVTKSLAFKFLPVFCNNYGVFGLRGNFLWFTPVVLFVILILLSVEKRKLSFVGLSAIFAGGVSNLVDRIIFGCVRDFITVVAFPSFNLADSIITIGFCILLFGTIFEIGIRKQ